MKAPAEMTDLDRLKAFLLGADYRATSGKKLRDLRPREYDHQSHKDGEITIAIGSNYVGRDAPLVTFWEFDAEGELYSFGTFQILRQERSK